jgi:hypothetical protein
MVVRWLVAAVAAAGCTVAGCATVPPDPRDRVLLDVDDSTGRVASTSRAPVQFTMEFADRGARMPQRLVLDGVNRLAEGQCPNEGGIGIAVYPAALAAAPMLGGDTTASSTLTVDMAGPAVARVKVEWTMPFECNLAQREGKGTSTFTIFPNGRIVRHDITKPTAVALSVDTNPCGCSAESNFYLTSYWAFAPTQNVNPDGTPFIDGSLAGCAVYASHMIGVAWPDSHTRVITDNNVSAFTYEWVTDSTTLSPDERELVSAIVMSKGTAAAKCGDVLADLDDFPIMIDGSSVSTDDSGIYVDMRSHTGRVEISAPRRVPSGFAVSLDVGGFGEITRSPPADGDWYGSQSDNGRTLFWFRDALAVGEKISIEPR